MKLAWLTDIHLDHADDDATRQLIHQVGDADGVLIGGDIANADSLQDELRRLADALDRPIWFVLGNHDYYHGDIRSIRRLAAALTNDHPHLHWLPEAGPVSLDHDVALVGHGGWGDGRLGDFDHSTVMLNDYLLIEDLANLDPTVRKTKLRALGAGAAATLAPHLYDALEQASTVIVLTHVPPFHGACWHLGELSDDNWLPHFSCAATGELLTAASTRFPDTRIRVYCGHTHSEGTHQPAPNLTVFTGKAEYGAPEVNALLDTSALNG